MVMTEWILDRDTLDDKAHTSVFDVFIDLQNFLNFLQSAKNQGNPKLYIKSHVICKGNK
jgi:hypothetical protein